MVNCSLVRTERGPGPYVDPSNFTCGSDLPSNRVWPGQLSRQPTAVFSLAGLANYVGYYPSEVDLCCNLRARYSMDDLTKLLEAVKQGDLDQVRIILTANKELVCQRDELGATPVHYAALQGHREIVRLLLDHGAEINSVDSQFGATPTGWAIEYLRERGGYLAIELSDLSYAISLGDVRWVARFLERFPLLRGANDTNGRPFQELARESGNREIADLFRVQAV